MSISNIIILYWNLAFNCFYIHSQCFAHILNFNNFLIFLQIFTLSRVLFSFALEDALIKTNIFTIGKSLKLHTLQNIFLQCRGIQDHQLFYIFGRQRERERERVRKRERECVTGRRSASERADGGGWIRSVFWLCRWPDEGEG